MVAATKSIDEMTQFLPQRKEELVMISGFGRAKVNNYGEQFLSIINEYCAEHGLASNVDQIPSKKERTPRSERKEKVDTKALSYDLYKKGNTIAEVAATRNLAVTTVEGHLASYVAKGLIPVQEFIEAEKLGIIEPALENYDGGPITPIMAQLENKVSFSEIRFALAAKEWEKLQTA
jgi:ATP-dependent DNA helicase RecQ